MGTYKNYGRAESILHAENPGENVVANALL